MSWREVAKEFGTTQEWCDLAQKAAFGSPLQRMAEEIVRLRFELKLAIEHDRQPYPTAEAYELVCKARDRYKAKRAKLRESLELIESNPSTSPMTKIFCRTALAADAAEDA